jgi:DNA primase
MINQVDEIKNKLDIAEVIGDYIQLKKSGTSYRALCPFHHEKTPSFFVSPEKQIWHCFGCNEGGDIFTFVQKMEGIEFSEALKILAQKAGVKLESEIAKTDTRTGRLKEILDMAAEYYHKNLFAEEGTEAREYLKKRGLDKETVIEFSLGFAPDAWDRILNYLKKSGFTETEIALTGLLVQKEGKITHYDRFRNRVMFPIYDIYNNVVGFTSRILPSAENDPKAGGKYVNTPQTAIYDKSRVLYGLNKAKLAVKEKDCAIIVEGNMDVITCHQFGYKNVVASSGTALTEGQLDLIKRFTKNLYLCFDVDPAGELAAKRGIDMALERGLNIKIVQIPAGCGKDPDECIRKDKSAWEKALDGAKDIMDYYFDKYLLSSTRAGKDLTLDEKSKAVNALIIEIAKLPSAVKQSHFIHVLSNLSGVKEDILFDELKRIKKNPPKTRAGNEPSKPLLAQNNRHSLLSERLLALALYSPKNFDSMLLCAPKGLFAPSCQTLYIQFAEYYNMNKSLDFFGLKSFLEQSSDDSSQIKTLSKVALFAEKEFDSFNEKEINAEITKTADELRQCFILTKRRELEEEIKKAESAGDKELMKKLVDEFNALIT